MLFCFVQNGLYASVHNAKHFVRSSRRVNAVCGRWPASSQRKKEEILSRQLAHPQESSRCHLACRMHVNRTRRVEKKSFVAWFTAWFVPQQSPTGRRKGMLRRSEEH